MKLLDQYLGVEITLPFLVGLTGFILIEIGTLLFNGLIEAMIQARAPMDTALQILLLKLPLFVVLALPIATLFGVSLGVNRLAREGEINAMRMAGVPLRRMLVPLLFIGLCISVVDYLINEKVAPPANARAKEMISKMWFQSEIPTIQADTFFKVQNHWFYLGTVEKNSDNQFLAKNVMVYIMDPGHHPTLIVAEKAVTNGEQWTLLNCETYYPVKNTMGSAPRYDVPFKIAAEQFFGMQRGVEEMSSTELGSQIQKILQGGLNADLLVMHYHLKFSIPIGCMVVVLVSMPLAVHFSRSGSFVGVLLSIVLFFFYYNTYFLARLLGSEGVLPPVVAAWAHNVIFAVIGGVMLWREE
jgi:lipopolysaccharide export system permease protein